MESTNEQILEIFSGDDPDKKLQMLIAWLNGSLAQYIFNNNPSGEDAVLKVTFAEGEIWRAFVQALAHSDSAEDHDLLRGATEEIERNERNGKNLNALKFLYTDFEERCLRHIEHVDPEAYAELTDLLERKADEPNRSETNAEIDKILSRYVKTQTIH